MDRKACKVKVVIRVRPPLKPDDKTCVSASQNSVQIFNHRNVTEDIKYDFSAVYGMDSTQLEIYTECVKPLLPNALNGQNVSIFAYGPTGAGKTHTMLGTSNNPGVIPRVINGIFELIEEAKQKDGDEWQYKVTFSFLEIYNEKVQDLLEPSGSDLPIREDAEKNILVPGLAKKEIHNFEEFKMAFGPASNNRTVAATKLNEHSSRSHSIVQLTITKSKPCRVLHGKIYLIDLAGSEDNRRTGNQGIRLKESGAINKSLFSLGEVVDAINCGLPRIPYRNSKLTRLLQDSIGGTCHSMMITNIAPEERYYYDTYCTLNFATKSKKIVNNTVIRETVGIVKPVPQVRKASPIQRESESKVKRPRLDSSTDSVCVDAAPSLSPLMKRQEQWEENVNKRLEELETNLIKQMKTIHPVLPGNLMEAGAQTPKTKAIQEMQRQLAASHAQLKELASRHMISPPPLQPVVPTVIENPPVLQDKTNVVNPVIPKSDFSKPERPISGIKRKKQEEFTCSPLFARPPGRLKKTKSASSVSASSSKGTVEVNVPKEEKKETAKQEHALSHSASQQKRNEEFLQVLNSSSVKDLQNLQTVGAKRAKLIFEWRENYGAFATVEDLKQVPGFSEKTFQKLLHSNLVTVT